MSRLVIFYCSDLCFFFKVLEVDKEGVSRQEDIVQRVSRFFKGWVLTACGTE